MPFELSIRNDCVPQRWRRRKRRRLWQRRLNNKMRNSNELLYVDFLRQTCCDFYDTIIQEHTRLFEFATFILKLFRWAIGRVDGSQ